ncbi:unnamed protein product, partial [Amoebophrya sp. A120]
QGQTGKDLGGEVFFRSMEIRFRLAKTDLGSDAFVFLERADGVRYDVFLDSSTKSLRTTDTSTGTAVDPPWGDCGTGDATCVTHAASGVALSHANTDYLLRVSVDEASPLKLRVTLNGLYTVYGPYLSKDIELQLGAKRIVAVGLAPGRNRVQVLTLPRDLLSSTAYTTTTSTSTSSTTTLPTPKPSDAAFLTPPEDLKLVPTPVNQHPSALQLRTPGFFVRVLPKKYAPAAPSGGSGEWGMYGQDSDCSDLLSGGPVAGTLHSGSETWDGSLNTCAAATSQVGGHFFAVPSMQKTSSSSYTNTKKCCVIYKDVEMEYADTDDANYDYISYRLEGPNSGTWDLGFFASANCGILGSEFSYSYYGRCNAQGEPASIRPWQHEAPGEVFDRATEGVEACAAAAYALGSVTFQVGHRSSGTNYPNCCRIFHGFPKDEDKSCSGVWSHHLWTYQLHGKAVIVPDGFALQRQRATGTWDTCSTHAPGVLRPVTYAVVPRITAAPSEVTPGHPEPGVVVSGVVVSGDETDVASNLIDGDFTTQVKHAIDPRGVMYAQIDLGTLLPGGESGGAPVNSLSLISEVAITVNHPCVAFTFGAAGTTTCQSNYESDPAALLYVAVANDTCVGQSDGCAAQLADEDKTVVCEALQFAPYPLTHRSRFFREVAPDMAEFYVRCPAPFYPARFATLFVKNAIDFRLREAVVRGYGPSALLRDVNAKRAQKMWVEFADGSERRISRIDFWNKPHIDWQRAADLYLDDQLIGGFEPIAAYYAPGHPGPLPVLATNLTGAEHPGNDPPGSLSQFYAHVSQPGRMVRVSLAAHKSRLTKQIRIQVDASARIRTWQTRSSVQLGAITLCGMEVYAATTTTTTTSSTTGGASSLIALSERRRHFYGAVDITPTDEAQALASSEDMQIESFAKHLIDNDLMTWAHTDDMNNRAQRCPWYQIDLGEVMSVRELELVFYMPQYPELKDLRRLFYVVAQNSASDAEWDIRNTDLDRYPEGSVQNDEGFRALVLPPNLGRSTSGLCVTQPSGHCLATAGITTPACPKPHEFHVCRRIRHTTTFFGDGFRNNFVPWTHSNGNLYHNVTIDCAGRPGQFAVIELPGAPADKKRVLPRVAEFRVFGNVITTTTTTTTTTTGTWTDLGVAGDFLDPICAAEYSGGCAEYATLGSGQGWAYPTAVGTG